MPNMRLRNLDKMTTSKRGDERTLQMSRPTSSSGKVMERCPDSECQPAVFQLGQAPDEQQISDEDTSRARREPGTDGVTCPYCGTDGDDQDFVPDEDIKHAEKEIMHAVKKDFSDMLGGMAKDFNRRNRPRRGDMISMSMDHKPGHSPRPFAYREDLLRDISCHVCGREYGVYALALFCPDCGCPNVSTHFDREVEIIDQQIELSKQMESDGKRELAWRLLANAHEDALTAMETTLKTVYRHIVHTHFPDLTEKLANIGNAFQNLERAEKKFRALNIDLLEDLSDTEQTSMVQAIQKRHVIGHNLGLADEKYTRTVEDAEVGRNVPVVAEEIEHFAALCAKLVRSVEEELSN